MMLPIPRDPVIDWYCCLIWSICDVICSTCCAQRAVLAVNSAIVIGESLAWVVTVTGICAKIAEGIAMPTAKNQEPRTKMVRDFSYSPLQRLGANAGSYCSDLSVCLETASGTLSVLGATRRPFCSWRSGPSSQASTRYARGVLGAEQRSLEDQNYSSGVRHFPILARRCRSRKNV